MTTVSGSVPMLRWADRRARLHDDDLAACFRKWPLWLSEGATNAQATRRLRQAEAYERIKIPSVRIGLGLRVMTAYEMLGKEKRSLFWVLPSRDCGFSSQ